MGTQDPAGESVLSAPEHVFVRKAGDETVLLNLRTEHYYGLEGVGARFWELVEAQTTFGDAVEVLQSEYHVAADTVRSDLLALSSDLRKNGLLLVDGA